MKIPTRNKPKMMRAGLISTANSANTRYHLLTLRRHLNLTTLSPFARNMTAPRPARPKPLDWSRPSHLAIFVRNLKLLHLDQRDDWPGITIRTLSPSSQNQRQRIRLIEWSLYYLFTIWDPEGAQNVFSNLTQPRVLYSF